MLDEYEDDRYYKFDGTIFDIILPFTDEIHINKFAIDNGKYQVLFGRDQINMHHTITTCIIL